MSVNVGIVDGHGSGNNLKVNGEGELGVVVHTHPPKNESFAARPFVSFLTDSNGSSDMLVNGATTNVEFNISADKDLDVFVKNIAVTIVDAAATLAKFGALTALTNGVLFEWITADLGTTTINSGIKTNFEFFRQALQEPIISSNVVGNSEGLLIEIDFAKIFGLRNGLRLRAGTNDKIAFTIRDNVSTMDQFDAIAYGIKF